jgi:hypothetical protein
MRVTDIAKIELRLALVDRARDRRSAGRLGRAGERDVAFAGEQAARWDQSPIQPAPGR